MLSDSDNFYEPHILFRLQLDYFRLTLNNGQLSIQFLLHFDL